MLVNAMHAARTYIRFLMLANMVMEHPAEAFDPSLTTHALGACPGGLELPFFFGSVVRGATYSIVIHKYNDTRKNLNKKQQVAGGGGFSFFSRLSREKI